MIDILFLDIDGVLNRRGTVERCGGFLGVDRELSERLLAWTRRAGIKIVLSSTWRLHPDMWRHLMEAGINWIGITPDFKYELPRAYEIDEWLRANAGKWGALRHP